MTELLPCPFCGARALHQEITDVDMCENCGTTVKCVKCGARADTRREWNTRAESPELHRANEVIKVLEAGLLSCQWEFENLGKKHGGLYSENGIELCKQALAKAKELKGNGGG